MFDKWIEALGKYEKHTGTFVPYKYNEELGGYVLVKENCACALGVYLIEVEGIDPKEIASNRYQQDKYYDLLTEALGVDFVAEVWHVNDETHYDGPEVIDPTFGTVIELIKAHK